MRMAVLFSVLELAALLLFIYMGQVGASPIVKYGVPLVPLFAILPVAISNREALNYRGIARIAILAAIIFVVLFQAISLKFGGLSKGMDVFSSENIGRLCVIAFLATVFHVVVLTLGLVINRFRRAQ